MLRMAKDYVGDHPFAPYKFESVDERIFVERYCKVVFSSGFRVDIAEKHLAMTIGLTDTAKDDRWLERCAEACSATFDEFVSYLAKTCEISKQKVDSYLFLYCKDHGRIPSV